MAKKNPFLNFQQYETKPPRNSVDLSHRYNGTFGLGTLYPVLCTEVDPGDTFSIESAFGLKFFPMPFPIQTPMRATMHFYYVRNRTIWKDFPDFIYNNKSASVIPHPFIARPASDTEFWKTGGIADYLDVPTTIVTDDGTGVSSGSAYGFNYTSSPVGRLAPYSSDIGFGDYRWVDLADPRAFAVDYRLSASGRLYGPTLRNMIVLDAVTFAQDNSLLGCLYGSFPGLNFTTDINGLSSFTLHFTSSLIDSLNSQSLSDIADTMHAIVFYQSDAAASAFGDGDFSRNPDLLDTLVPVALFDCDSVSTDFSVGSSAFDAVFTTNSSSANAAYFLSFMEHFSSGRLWIFVGQNDSGYDKIALYPSPWGTVSFQHHNHIGRSCFVDVPLSNSADLSSGEFGNPFAGNDPALPISALPFRAYEAIYNAYYRNERLEPLMIDGVPEYNKYCPNMESGADTFPYRLYKRNWEADFLTSALPTPQQGIAPVVGVAGLSNVQIQDPDSNEIYNFTADIDPGDGETIVGGSFHDPSATTAVRRTAAELVTAGFTINDFRNVNALQRWLENNFRRGLKYRDQILANTGVKVKYDELDMPEFIGGFSRPVQVTSVTQTAPGDLGVGDYAGQANCFGQSKHRISHYCDEAGFIMGILCVTPQPVYSQLLPKHFLKRTALDYHHPVMNHIGMQPITYDQVCPLQVYAFNPTQSSDNGLRFNDVFGYQRPFYDLLAKTDSVHGQMRTTLRNYVMNRTFSDVPELGAEFVHVDPKQLNQVFNITSENEDVIMGEILFRIFAKRTVSLFGQPKIV